MQSSLENFRDRGKNAHWSIVTFIHRIILFIHRHYSCLFEPVRKDTFVDADVYKCCH